MLTKRHSKFFIYTIFSANIKQTEKFNENRADKSSKNHLQFVYRIECTAPFTYH